MVAAQCLLLSRPVIPLPTSLPLYFASSQARFPRAVVSQMEHVDSSTSDHVFMSSLARRVSYPFANFASCQRIRRVLPEPR